MVCYARHKFNEFEARRARDKVSQKMPRVDWGEVLGTQTCMVCLDNFAEPGLGLQLRATSPSCAIVLPCNHAAHRKCVEIWFEQQGSCPYCRHAVGGLQECRVAHASDPRKSP